MLHEYCLTTSYLAPKSAPKNMFIFSGGRRADELEPDVSLMPDFENVCEESQATFMIEEDIMPSVDDVDQSRYSFSTN